MTLTVREGRAMVEAVRKHKRVFQTGSQQRSMEQCRFGCELVRNGRVGKIQVVHANNYPSPWEPNLPEQPVPEGLDWDMWLGQTPLHPYHEEIYLPRVRGTEAGWISFRAWSGGEMTGWGAHGLDIIQWALGMDESGPVEVWPEGQGLKCPVTFKYANGIVVKLDDKGPHGGGLFIGEKGKILIDRGKCVCDPVELGKEPLSSSDVHLYKSANHMQNWLDCIRSRKMPVADVEIGHRTATMCHLGNIARWTGRKLRWNPAQETFVGDEEANTFLERPMRAPWKL
jgi:predicted dehydrogenase